ncbi:hypothetical protein BH23ACT4_BH23ACT4_01750 [soil metagenome]
MRDEPFDMLSTYLDDHRAGAAAGRALSKRMARENSDIGWAEKLADLADEIEADDRTLGQLRRVLGIRGGLAKRALARVAAAAGRLKLNRRLVGYSPLSRVLEAEAMMAGVTAKKCLWVAMRTCDNPGDQTAQFDFAALEKRALDQIQLLTEFHAASAKAAFSGNASQTI